MQGIYAYIPETNYVPREYSVAAILLLLFTVLLSLVSVLNLLYFYISTFRSVCAVSNMAVFCSSLTSCFPGMLLMYFLNYSQIVPVDPIYYYYYYYYKHDIKELQQTAILGTADEIRTVLRFNIGYSITCTVNCNHKITATFYIVETSLFLVCNCKYRI